MKCQNCRAQTINQKFCSIRCGTIFNNRKRGTGKTSPKQCVCGVTINYRSKACKLHAPHVVMNAKDWSKITLGEARRIRKYQAHSRIRELARVAYYRSGKTSNCYICGYTLKIDVAHIKAISSYDDATPVSVVNSIDNLVGLCPNHHWEFDHGHLSLYPCELTEQMGGAPLITTP
jgi:hypothetical protein